MGQGKSKLSQDDLAELQKQTYFNRRELNQYVVPDRQLLSPRI